MKRILTDEQRIKQRGYCAKWRKINQEKSRMLGERWRKKNRRYSIEYNKQHYKRKKTEKKCDNCGNPFNTSNHFTLCKKCRYQKKGDYKSCRICGNPFFSSIKFRSCCSQVCSEFNLADIPRRQIEGLSNSYVASILSIPTALCPPELIALRRVMIQTRRLVKQIKNKST